MRPPVEAGTATALPSQLGRVLLEPPPGVGELRLHIVGPLDAALPLHVALRQTVPVPVDLGPAGAAGDRPPLRMQSTINDSRQRAPPLAVLRQISMPAPARMLSEGEPV